MKRPVYKEKTGEYSVKLEYGEPGFYHVVLLKDEFTTMEFVLNTLEKFFNMDRRSAVEVMQRVQEEGQAVCGLYTKDVAATKIAEVKEFAMKHEFPLVCSMEAV